MVQQRAMGEAGRQPQGTQQQAAVPAGNAQFSFNPDSAVRAIVFHLLDEKLAKEVGSDSVKRTVERLTARSFASAISRREWVAMTNSQRLEWLLAESQTITLVGAEDVVHLRARRSR